MCHRQNMVFVVWTSRPPPMPWEFKHTGHINPYVMDGRPRQYVKIHNIFKEAHVLT